jgi:hypothetical protein
MRSVAYHQPVQGLCNEAFRRKEMKMIFTRYIQHAADDSQPDGEEGGKGDK